MSTLLKKQIAYTKQQQNASVLMKLWLLVLHVILGAYQVLTMLFMSPMSSFQEVHDLTEDGYKVSYLDHCRLQHNVRFGTLAYSMVLVIAITLVRTSIEIIYPDKFNQAAYAASLVVNKTADTNDGVCDADCSLREAIAVAANGDTISFDVGLTGQSIVLTAGQITINQSNLVIDGSNRNVTIDGNNSVAVCIRINNTATNTQLANFNMRRCTTTMISMEATGSLVKSLNLSEVGTAGVVMNANSTSVDTLGITGTSNVTNNCIAIVNNRSGISVSNTEIQACKTAVGGGSNVQQVTISGNYIVASSISLLSFSNSSNVTVTNNRFGQKRNLSNGFCSSTAKFNAVSSLTFSNNTFSGCTSTLLDITGGSSITINGNTFSGPNVPGVQLLNGVKIDGGSIIRIYGNTFSNATSPGSYALMLTNTPSDVVVGKNTDNSLSANTFQNNVAGVYATGTTVLIKGNSFTGNTQDIETSNFSDSFIQGNTFNSPTLGVRMHSSTDDWVLNNTFSGAYSDHALQLDTQSTNATITGNQFTNTTSDDAVVIKEASDNCAFYSNDIAMVSVGETQSAVNIKDTDSCQIYSNDIDVAGGYSVILNGDSDNNVVGCTADVSDTTGTNVFGSSTSLADVLLVSAQANGNSVRCNHSSADPSVRLALMSGAVDLTPTGTQVTTHNTQTIAGVTEAGGIVDVYGDGKWLGAALAGSDGSWSFSLDPAKFSGDLSQYSELTVTVTTAIGTGTFTSYVQPTGDVTISDLTAADITETEATITWSTLNVPTKSVVSYQADGADAQVVDVDDRTEEHSYTLTGLTAGTDYTVVITAADISNEHNVDTDSVQFTTDTTNNQQGSLRNYSETVAKTMRVNHGITHTNLDGSEDNLVFSRTDTNTNLTFIFTDSQDRLASYRLHLMLKAVDQANQIVYNKKKAFNNLGKAKFTVKQLETEKTYAVYTGVVDRNNDYVNKNGLTKRFNFTIQDAPQMFYPGSAVFNGNPQEIWVSSKSPSVTVEALDSNSNVIYSCVATMASDHYGSCRPPYQLPGLGNYSFRLTDSRGGVNTIPTLISGPVSNMNSPTLVTDSRHPDFLKRMFYGPHPTFTGVTGANHTVELHIPQINGAIFATVNAAQAGNPTTTWSYTHLLTDWPQGMATTVTIIDRNPDGSISNQFTYQTYRSFLPVVPAIVAPADNAFSTTGPQVQLTGADFLEVLNSDGQRLLLTDFVDRSRVVDLAQLGYTQPGDYTVSFRSFNRSRLLSRLVPFRFRIRPVRTATITNGNTNTNGNSNTNTNGNVNTNTNTNGNTNTNNNVNSNSNNNDNTNTDTNSNGNDNTNTVEPTNDNANTSTTNDNTNSSNTNSTVVGDSDHDGLSTEAETEIYHTDPLDNDTDDDTLFDGDEVEFGSDPLQPDADADGANDAIELIFQTDPNDSDTDDDGVLDGTEVANRTSPTDADTDDDGLNDNENSVYGTLVLDADTDNDRLLDGDEVERNCNPLKADSDGDGIDDLSEALAATSCTSADNVWKNLTGLEEFLQDKARSVYAASGVETASYPHLTTQVVPVDKGFKEKLNNRIRTATVVDYVAGAHTVVSKGQVTVVTRTSEVSLLDWLNGQAGTENDDTFVLVQGTVDLPANVQDQPAYVIITFFSAPTVKIAKVDSNGQWTMSVPAELLTAGEHTAFAAVDVNGTQSDQIEVAKFVIKNERRLSNTSWLVIANIAIAIIALLIAAFIHLRHKRANQATTTV